MFSVCLRYAENKDMCLTKFFFVVVSISSVVRKRKKWMREAVCVSWVECGVPAASALALSCLSGALWEGWGRRW